MPVRTTPRPTQRRGRRCRKACACARSLREALHGCRVRCADGCGRSSSGSPTALRIRWLLRRGKERSSHTRGRWVRRARARSGPNRRQTAATGLDRAPVPVCHPSPAAHLDPPDVSAVAVHSAAGRIARAAAYPPGPKPVRRPRRGLSGSDVATAGSRQPRPVTGAPRRQYRQTTRSSPRDALRRRSGRPRPAAGRRAPGARAPFRRRPSPR